MTWGLRALVTTDTALDALAGPAARDACCGIEADPMDCLLHVTAVPV
jgi:hypothetical protein